MGQPRPLLYLFLVFFKQTMHLLKQINVKNVHLVYDAGIEPTTFITWVIAYNHLVYCSSRTMLRGLQHLIFSYLYLGRCMEEVTKRWIDHDMDTISLINFGPTTASFFPFPFSFFPLYIDKPYPEVSIKLR